MRAGIAYLDARRLSAGLLQGAGRRGKSRGAHEEGFYEGRLIELRNAVVQSNLDSFHEILCSINLYTLGFYHDKPGIDALDLSIKILMLQVELSSCWLSLILWRMILTVLVHL